MQKGLGPPRPQEVHAAAAQLVRSERAVAGTQIAVDALLAQLAALRGSTDLAIQRGSKLPALQRQAAGVCQALLAGSIAEEGRRGGGGGGREGRSGAERRAPAPPASSGGGGGG